jgi:DNA-binding response OmpR family regulator
MADAPLVLVVDDDVDSRTLLEVALSMAGYDVATAVNGLHALDVARARRPRVILLDLAMPVMDGFEFRARQLRDSSLALIPVICVSGRHDAAVASSQLRVAACIPKPFDLDDVLTRVGQLLPGTSVPAARS